jgi:Zn-dependent protease with chaperone function
MRLTSLQQIAYDILARLGVGNILVAVVPVEYNTIAAAAGVTFNLKPLVDGINAVGLIHVQKKYLRHFSEGEWKFIIAHECAHIFHNHMVDTLFWKLIEGIVKGPKNEHAALVDLAKIIVTLFSSERIPPDAITLRNNEYTADATALTITKDINAAKSCLVRLSNNDPNSASHLFDIAGQRFPIMTLGTRIKVLESRYQSYLRMEQSIFR